MRARIAEDEEPATAREKLAATVAEYVPDERERRLVEPRLAHLLGLEQRAATDRADLFSGWRLFFERLAEHEPVALVFEDLQWADSGAAGVHRPPARVVGRPADLRARPRPPGAARAPPGWRQRATWT